MLRIISRLRTVRCSSGPRSVVSLPDTKGTAPIGSSPNDSVGPVVPQLQMDRLARYIPTDSTAFMVESHRLTPAEKATQNVSAYLPWLLFGVFATAPFFVMKYNLEKMSRSSEERPTQPTYTAVNKRIPFQFIEFKDMPEVIERRRPTLVGVVTENFHSSLLLSLLSELDRILSEFNVDVSVAVFDIATASDPSFTSKYPPMLGPYCQLVSPGNSLVDYNGAVSVEHILEFLLGDGKISPVMRQSARRADERMHALRECVFRRKFVERKTWNVSDSLDLLDTALVRCQS